MKDPVSYEIAAYIGSAIGTLIASAIVAGFYYFFLVIVIKFPLTYLQIWGGVIVFDCIMNAIKNKLQE